MSTDDTQAFESAPRPTDETEAIDPEQRLDEVIAAYLKAVQAGQAPPQKEWLARHPDLASELAEFFADRERIERLAEPVRAVVTAGPPLGTMVRYIGDYELLEELGRGGMGVVYKAQQTKLRRLVALKMILSGEYAGDKELARFRSEGEAVARLQHPHIVQIFEVGEHEGHPYFSMEYCVGGSLEKKLHGTPLPPKDAAQLLETLAHAMHAAHQAGVVHRDLKPANVLLTADDTPKITDFGLAKKLDDVAGPTASGAIMGTPSYMAPEQAGGKSKQIGPAADVYALGAILFEMLTGRPPFKAATPLDTVMQVVNDEPVPPRQLQSQTPRDLETICLKCLQKEPKKRYASAGALAEDLQRFLEGRPIAARPIGVAERSWRWCRRNPAVAALLGVCVVAGVSLLVGGLLFNQQLLVERDLAHQERNKAVAQEQIARTQKAVADDQRHLAVERETEAKEQRERAVQGEAAAKTQLDYARRSLMTTQLLRVTLVMERDPAYGLELLEDANACPPDLRDFAWGFYYQLCKRDRLTLGGNDGHVIAVAFTADGKTLASGSGRHVKLWDVLTGKERATLKGQVSSLTFTADGKTLACGSGDGTVKLWDMATGKERATLKHTTLKGHTGWVGSVAFTADGKTLASGSTVLGWDGKTTVWLPGEVKLWDAATGEERHTLRNIRGARCMAFTADGKTLASGSGDGTVKLWDLATGKELATLNGHDFEVLSVAFTADGKTLASGSLDRTVKLWDLATGKERVTLKHTGVVNSVAFTADGKTLASGGWEPVTGKPIGNVRLWDVATGQERRILKGHTLGVNSVAFSADGKTLASGSGDGTTKLWDQSTNQERATLKGQGLVTSLAFTADSKNLVSAGGPNVRFWEVATGQERAILMGQPLGVNSVAIIADGKTLATGSVFGTVKLWDMATGKERTSVMGHAGSFTSWAFAADGKTLASWGEGKPVKLWDVVTGREIASLKSRTGRIMSAAFTADSKTLATGGGEDPKDPPRKKGQVEEGDEKAVKDPGKDDEKPDPKKKKPPEEKPFDPSRPGELKLWDVATGLERASLVGHTDVVTSVTFTPDGKTLASASGDRTIKLWNVATGKERATLKGHTNFVYSLAVTADGKILASGGGGIDVQGQGVPGEIKLWDVATGQERATIRGHTPGVSSLAFTPDGKTLASGNWDGTVKLWEAVFPDGQP